MIPSSKDLEKSGIVSIRDYLLTQKPVDVCRLESGDPSFPIPIGVKLAITKALNANKTHYMPGSGLKELRETIYKNLLNKNFNIDSANSVFVTTGAMNALYVVFKSLIGKKNTFYVQSPVWTEISSNILVNGGKISYYDSENPDFKYRDDLVAIVLNTPHNPTGKVYSKKEILRIIEFCEKHDLWLIVDEAYEKIVYYPHEHISPGTLSNYNKIITIHSFSKSYAMSGLRVGYIILNDLSLESKISKYIRCTTNGVNSISQYGALEAIKNTPNVYFLNNLQEYKRRKDILYNALKKCSFLTPTYPQGTFFMWCKITNDKTDWEVVRSLLKKGIGSAPGAVFSPAYTKDYYIRFAFSCATLHIERASNIMREM